MNTVYESIISGLAEAVDDAESKEKKLTRRVVSIVPVKEYEAEQIKRIRKSTGMSQKVFASYMGVSDKTVEAWEAGTNHPSGAASRLLSMMEMDEHLVDDFPFVKTTTN
ncbi:MAG: helix-turn-helix domain-containing protein [Lachnospiraceae bacterium]|nr:helix-turn-helix domain-containing protein [Lachnospiraceae bacterium]